MSYERGTPVNPHPVNLPMRPSTHDKSMLTTAFGPFKSLHKMAQALNPMTQPPESNGTRWAARCQTDGQIDGQIDGHADGQIDGQSDGEPHVE